MTSYAKCVTNFPASRRRPLPTGAIQLTKACWRSTSCPWRRPDEDETRGIDEPAGRAAAGGRGRGGGGGGGPAPAGSAPPPPPPPPSSSSPAGGPPGATPT